jgi:aromatic ring-cleaving dioxygenase
MATKFGISASGGARGIIQPKLKYKYKVEFSGLQGQTGNAAEFTRNVMTADRPKITYEEVPIHSYNSRVYVAGKHEWNTVGITFRDDVENRIVNLVGQQVQRQVDHHNQVSTMSGQDYKFGVSVSVLTGQDESSSGVIDAWDLEGCWITNVDYDAGDYSASDPVTVILTIRFDNALHAGSGGALMPAGNTTAAGTTATLTAGDTSSTFT